MSLKYKHYLVKHYRWVVGVTAEGCHESLTYLDFDMYPLEDFVVIDRPPILPGTRVRDLDYRKILSVSGVEWCHSDYLYHFRAPLYHTARAHELNILCD